MRQRMGLIFDLLLGRNSKVIATLIPFGLAGQPAWSPTGFPTAYRNYRANVLVFSTINATADTSAAVKLIAIDKRKGEPLGPDHPLQMLVDRPNPFMSGNEFLSAIIVYLKLAGRAYWEKARSPIGLPVALWPLRPDWVAPLPDSKVFIRGYRYAPPGLTPQDLDKANIVDFHVFDPGNYYGALSPAQVALREVDIDLSISDFLRLFFERGGAPPGVLKTKQHLHQSQVDAIRARWRERYGGYQQWHDPVILDSDAEYQKIGLTFKEMGFETLDDRTEARICMVMRTPPIIIGARIGLERSTFANYGEARKSWWQDVLVPEYERIADVLNQDVARDFGDDVALKFDFGEVPALQEDRTERWTRATAAFQAGAVTLNEFYAEVGLPDIGPAGDFYVRTLAMIEVPKLHQVMKPPVKPTKPSIEEEEEEQTETEKSRHGPHKPRKPVGKSPECRQAGETTQECVARKIPEILKENPDMDEEQAVAIAHSMCEKPCKAVDDDEDDDNDEKGGLGATEGKTSVAPNVPDRDERFAREHRLQADLTSFLRGQGRRIMSEVQ